MRKVAGALGAIGIEVLGASMVAQQQTAPAPAVPIPAGLPDLAYTRSDLKQLHDWRLLACDSAGVVSGPPSWRHTSELPSISFGYGAPLSRAQAAR